MTPREQVPGINATELETKWFAAFDLARADNPILALCGPHTDSDTLAFRAQLRECGATLTADHAASSYGQPVVVCGGTAYGPAEWITAGPRIRHESTVSA